MNPEPLWAPGAADYLASILTGDEVGFEWGGGASSIWLAPRIRRLYVMETNFEWGDKIIKATPKNCVVWIRKAYKPDYLQRVEEVDPQPNLYLIDGHRRIDCLALVEELAKDGDIVVLDDALDYAEHMLEEYLVDGSWLIERFKQPHPHAGLPINHEKYSHLRNTVRTYAPATKETWICRV